jgi:hypothetical protein
MQNRVVLIKESEERFCRNCSCRFRRKRHFLQWIWMVSPIDETNCGLEQSRRRLSVLQWFNSWKHSKRNHDLLSKRRHSKSCDYFLIRTLRGPGQNLTLSAFWLSFREYETQRKLDFSNIRRSRRDTNMFVLHFENAATKRDLKRTAVPESCLQVLRPVHSTKCHLDRESLQSSVLPLVNGHVSSSRILRKIVQFPILHFDTYALLNAFWTDIFIICISSSNSVET